MLKHKMLTALMRRLDACLFEQLLNGTLLRAFLLDLPIGGLLNIKHYFLEPSGLRFGSRLVYHIWAAQHLTETQLLQGRMSQ